MDKTFFKNMTDKAKAQVEATAKRFANATDMKEPLEGNSNTSDISKTKDENEALTSHIVSSIDYSQEERDKTNSLGSTTESEETEETEGFVCPSCMTTFQSAEYLESHFKGVHCNTCPVCMLEVNSPEKLQEHYEAEHVKTTKRQSQFSKLREQLGKREGTTSRTSTNSIDQANTPEYIELESHFCHLCMVKFQMPEDLSEHYGTVHGRERETVREKILSSQFVKTIKMMKLKETSVGSAENIAEDESFLYKNQIAALEESKALLVSEVITLRKQVGMKESSVSDETILNMKVEDLKLNNPNDSEFVSLCIHKLAILDNKMTQQKNTKSSLEEKLKEIDLQKKALQAKYEDSVVEKKELVKSYDTLLKFKDKQLEDMKQKLKGMDDEPSSSMDVETEKVANACQTDDDAIKVEEHEDTALDINL